MTKIERIRAQALKIENPSERRRFRYQNDPEFRATVRRRERAAYKANKATKVRNCLDRLPVIHVYSRTRSIYDRDVLDPACQKITVRTYTTQELGAVLGYHYVVLNRWQRRGKFPYPQHWTTDRLPYRVYLEHEVRELVSVMAAHQRESQYLYDTDKETIDALFRCVERLKYENPASRLKEQRQATTHLNTSHGKTSTIKKGSVRKESSGEKRNSKRPARGKNKR